MQFSTRKSSSRLGLVTVILLIAAAAFGWFIVYPSFNSWQEEKAAYETAQASAASSRKSYEQQQKLLANYNSKRKELAIVSQTLPPAPKIPDLIDNLEILMLQAGMKIGDIKVTDASQLEEQAKGTRGETSADSAGSSKLVELVVDITASGQYEQIPVLLEAVERNQRFFDIVAISAQPLTGESLSGVTFRVTVKTFYEK